MLAAGEREASARWTAAFAELMVRLTGWSGSMDGLVWRLAGGAGHAADWREAAYGHARVPHFGDPVRNGHNFVGRQSGSGAGLFSIGWTVADTMLQAGLAMAGDVWVLSAMSWQARFVLLDAQGALSPRKKKTAHNGESEMPATNTNGGQKFGARRSHHRQNRARSRCRSSRCRRWSRPDGDVTRQRGGAVSTAFAGGTPPPQARAAAGSVEWIYKDPCRTLRCASGLCLARLAVASRDNSRSNPPACRSRSPARRRATRIGAGLSTRSCSRFSDSSRRRARHFGQIEQELPAIGVQADVLEKLRRIGR